MIRAAVYCRKSSDDSERDAEARGIQRQRDNDQVGHLPSTILWVCVPSPWMPMTTTSPLAR